MANFLVKCLSCGKVTVCKKGVNRICSICGQVKLIGVCAGCGESMEEQDVKDCKGLLVHNSVSCWNKCWDNV